MDLMFTIPGQTLSIWGLKKLSHLWQTCLTTNLTYEKTQSAPERLLRGEDGSTGRRRRLLRLAETYARRRRLSHHYETSTSGILPRSMAYGRERTMWARNCGQHHQRRPQPTWEPRTPLRSTLETPNRNPSPKTTAWNTLPWSSRRMKDCR